MPRWRSRHGQLTLDPFEQQSLPVALFQLLLEQSVAGPGAGQQQPEALEAETLGSEVSSARGAPTVQGVGRVGVDPAGSLLHAHSCWGGMWSQSSQPECTR